AEAEEGVPAGWDRDVAAAAVNLAELLGLIPPTGMILELLQDKQRVRQVTVTRRSAENLRRGLAVKRYSLGSVTGRLESVSTQGGYRAGVWQEGTGRRVEVRFVAEQVEQIHRVFGRRVMVSGELARDGAGRPLRIQLRTIEEIPEPARPLTDLAGLYPDMT